MTLRKAAQAIPTWEERCEAFDDMHVVTHADIARMMQAEIDDLRNAHPTPAQTPRSVTAEEDAILHKALLRGTKRLDAPAQTPMTNAEALELWERNVAGPTESLIERLIRATERHHGIGGTK